MDIIENRTFDELRIGDTASLEHVLTDREASLFATVTGVVAPIEDVSPDHVPPATARQGRSPHQGVWLEALLAAAVETRLPGPGATTATQSLRFERPARIGDQVTLTLTVREKRPGPGTVVLDCTATNQDGERLLSGEMEVVAPRERQRRSLAPLPEEVARDPRRRYRELVAKAKHGEPVATAIVHPCSAVALEGPLDAAREGVIRPVLVGPQHRIEGIAAEAGLDISGLRMVDTPHSHASADRAVDLARRGEVAMLMKGSLHTSELMHAVLARATGLRTERRISHACIMDVPAYDRPLIVTDAAINIQPDLLAKKDIAQNAIDMVRVLGRKLPKVAILSAVEEVNPAIPSTIDAAALCKMADRGQITGAVLDGPLAFDNAISAVAAKVKGIQTPVAGEVDILLVPNLESGNMLAKQLVYLAGALSAGIVLGTQVPIVLTSRTDGKLERIASCAIGALLARAKATGGIK